MVLPVNIRLVTKTCKKCDYSIGIFNSPKYDVSPQPNTRDIGPLVGRTSGDRHGIMHVLAVILSKTCIIYLVQAHHR